MLEVLDLEKKLRKSDYKRRMPALQHRLWELQRACWEASIPSILVFEGWDASGKGPCIRKLTERLEPRGFELHHVTEVPRTYELDLPWMWRFWSALPKYGQMAIFDRSWNRRALSARVKNQGDELQWRRRLRDIGDFERMLADDGYVLIKFFLHISKGEQKKRYERWKEDPGASWKALEGEWQEPKHYRDHLEAAEELLQLTEAPWSPWTLVPATDERWVRVTVLKRIIERLEEALVEREWELPVESGPVAPEEDNGDDDDDDD